MSEHDSEDESDVLEESPCGRLVIVEQIKFDKCGFLARSAVERKLTTSLEIYLPFNHLSDGSKDAKR